MMKNKQLFLVRLAGFFLAVCIPALITIDTVQAKRFLEVDDEIASLEKTQVQLVEENRKLITGISILSSADRIETIATGELGMRRAVTDEIIRVEMKKKDNP